jgi:hypothetical protein
VKKLLTEWRKFLKEGSAIDNLQKAANKGRVADIEVDPEEDHDEDDEFEEMEEPIDEAWKDDPEIKKMDKYGKEEMTKAELCAKRDKLKALEDRTEEETTELRRINFALRSRQKGPKFGKVSC